MLRRLGRRLYERVIDGPVLDFAAQLSFYLMLSVAPFFIVLAGLAAVLPVGRPLERALARAGPLMPAEAHSLVSTLLHDLLTHGSTTLLTVGTLVALWSCSRGVNVLRRVLNDAHGIDDPRSLWRVQGLALVLTVLVVLCVVLPLLGFLLAQELARAAGASWPTWWRNVTLPVLAVVLWGMVTVLFRRLPSTRPRWAAAALGSLVGTVLFGFAGWAFSWWVDAFGGYGVSHGSLASVTVLILWLYAASTAFIIGGEVSAAWGTRAPGLDVTPAAAPRG